MSDIFYSVQRSCFRSIACRHPLTTVVVLNQCATTLSMAIPAVVNGERTSLAASVLLRGTSRTSSSLNASMIATEINSNLSNLRNTLSSVSSPPASSVSKSVASYLREEGSDGEGKIARAAAAFNDSYLALDYLCKLRDIIEKEIGER